MTGSEQFEELIQLVRKKGLWYPPTLDIVAQKTLDFVGGWQELCNTKLSYLDVLKSKFCMLYPILEKGFKDEAGDSTTK